MKPTLQCDFTGVEMPNPFVLASAPPTRTTEMVNRAFLEGWGGAVFKTLTHRPELAPNLTPRIGAYKNGNSVLGFTNWELGSTDPLEKWAEDLHKLKKRWPDRALFVSLLDTQSLDEGAWRQTTRMFSGAGADGFELNLSCTHGTSEGCGASIGSSAVLVEQVTRWVAEETNRPVVAKLSVMVDDLPGKARAAQKGGASGISATNTLGAIAGVDLRTLTPLSAVGDAACFQGLSGRAIKPIALRCVAQIAQAVELPVSGIGGVYGWQDAAEFMLLGASTVQVCSAVMEHGYAVIGALTDGLLSYMKEMGFQSPRDLRGRALPNLKTHDELSRTYRVRAQVGDGCIGCGRCVSSCRDSGYQAIGLDEHNRAKVELDRCGGCGLCVCVCPAGCVGMGRW